MASVFLYHVVGDLTVGKPELSEFSETETLAAAIRTIGDTSEGGIPCGERDRKCAVESAESRQQRFVGILNALDIVAFLAREDCLADQDKAINTPVSEVVVPDSSALKVVDPGTSGLHNGVEFDCVFRVDFWQSELGVLACSQLDGATCALDFDLYALEMMKHGVKRFFVPKSSIWRGMSKRFSILYNGRWLKTRPPSGGSSTNTLVNTNRHHHLPLLPSRTNFAVCQEKTPFLALIGCLGALAPLPLSSIASLGAINPNYCCIEASRVRHRCHQRTSPRSPAVAARSPHQTVNIIRSSAKYHQLNYGNAIVWLLRGLWLIYQLDSLCCRTVQAYVWVIEAENDDNLVGVVGYADILSAVTRQPPAAAVSENSE
ncbi:hypothetical protein DH2020_028425 [Rehmannia glutinosa]|uniref:CBS domain-containing protein n=1 Tax=Rehmannia glutinosa TaxID=99300 RepID=A0ABR0VRE7_REHGL